MVGQGLQQHRVDHAEDRGVGADAERQRQHRHGREGGIARQREQRVAQIARQVLEPGPPGLVVQGVHRVRDAPGPERGRPYRVGGRAGAPPCVLGGELQVEPELLLPLGPRPPPAERSPEAAHPFAKCSVRHSNGI